MNGHTSIIIIYSYTYTGIVCIKADRLTGFNVQHLALIAVWEETMFECSVAFDGARKTKTGTIVVNFVGLSRQMTHIL